MNNNRYIYIGDNKIAVIDEVILGYLNDINKDCYTSYFKDYDNTIEVEPTHSWEINQVLEKDIDFVIAESYLKEGIIIEAIPLSKPNTDVKEDGLQKYRDNVDNRPCHEIAIEKAIKEAYIPSKLQEIFDACSEEEKAAFNKSKIVRSEPNPVKEGERLYSKEDMIGFAEWAAMNGWTFRMPQEIWETETSNGRDFTTSEQLFNLYLQSQKSNQ